MRDLQGHGASGLTSPKVQNNRSRVTAAALAIEEEKTDEEKAEEKKKMDMMRKFYRNRHSSFLHALA